ncbi:MAG TPA: hypothetical protein IAA60_03945 [Candidatus Ornithomonoglobus intestinigallinarum]|uniref:Uncharacterized protein n=1 Tax=Candidatus Ornithomonoglobus intestinigallinarum TaxID=2840894 RepID=A0A9D1H4G9_9FIRM|nr:hypothetical protein [Candidatus Ornithomonoglobus intestinigallinarum]
MKTIKKLLAAALAAALAVSSAAFTVSAASVADYENGTDWAENGPFPSTGDILHWTSYYQPNGFSSENNALSKPWYKNLSGETALDGYLYAADTTRLNPAFHFKINEQINDKDFWQGASTIKSGGLKIDTYVYVPELINPQDEDYTEYFSIWGVDDEGNFYNEQGCLFSVIMNGTETPYIGLTVDGHNTAVTEAADGAANIVKMEVGKWYKLTADIDYDNNTLDYYINDEYVCSHNDFEHNSEYYEMGSLYYAPAVDASSITANDTHVYVTGIKMSRYITAEMQPVIDMDFDDVAFATDGTSSIAFEDFWCEYQPYGEYTSNYTGTDFIDAKKYLEVADEDCEPGFYKKYDYRYTSPVEDGNGGQALNIHRHDEYKTPDYWGEHATMGLVIPFENGASVESGKMTIEFDGGKPAGTNYDLFTIGLRDKNNEVTTWSKTEAWTNSTALFGFGNWNYDATLIFNPMGRSATYGYTFVNSYPEDQLLWPDDMEIQKNNEINHYRVELDIDAKTYDIFRDNICIGDGLKLYETENAPSFDAFVIGSAFGNDEWTPNDTENLGFVIDNVKISATDVTAPPEMSGAFTDGGSGVSFTFDDCGYAGNYNVFIASYNENGTLASVEMFAKDKGAGGTYTADDTFEYEGKRVRAFVFGDDMSALIGAVDR